MRLKKGLKSRALSVGYLKNKKDSYTYDVLLKTYNYLLGVCSNASTRSSLQ